MSLKDEILRTAPTSYWPLDDPPSRTKVHDVKHLRDGQVAVAGVTLGVVPFGAALMPFFDGKPNSSITIPDDDRYSHADAGVLSVACWLCPMALNFEHTDGSKEQYVHPIEKAKTYTLDAEWAFRIVNADTAKPSRLSFYLFNLGTPVREGAGAYMQYGRSVNDVYPVQVGRWIFLVGQGEKWIDGTDKSTGAVLFKQGVQAVRSTGDKYNNPNWNVKPQNGGGPITLGGSIGKTWFRGAIAHVALWNRLLDGSEVEQMWREGLEELRATPMFQRY